MSQLLNQLVTEVIDAALAKGLSQQDLAERTIGAPALSRLKKASDVRLSTLEMLGKAAGKKLVWVDDQNDLASLIAKGDLF